MVSRNIIACLIAFVLPFYLFPTLYHVHGYYRTESAIFLIAAIAVLISALPNEKLRVIVTLAIVVVQFATFEQIYRPLMNRDDGMRILGLYIQRHTKPDDVLLIYGAEWSPELAYYAERKAIMCTTLASIATCEAVAKTVHIGEVVDCRSGGCKITFPPLADAK